MVSKLSRRAFPMGGITICPDALSHSPLSILYPLATLRVTRLQVNWNTNRPPLAGSSDAMNFSLIDVFVIPLLFYTLLFCQSPAKETTVPQSRGTWTTDKASGDINDIPPPANATLGQAGTKGHPHTTATLVPNDHRPRHVRGTWQRGGSF